MFVELICAATYITKFESFAFIKKATAGIKTEEKV